MTGSKTEKWAGLVRRSAFVLFAAFSGTSLLLSLPLVSHLLIDRLQVFPALTAADILSLTNAPDTAIVILAAGRRPYAPEFGGETVDSLALERLRYGAELGRRTRLPILVSGGAPTREPIPLAQLMAEVLSRDFGLAVKWEEGHSTNTAENAIYSAALLKGMGIDRVVLVTHAWHMKRAVASFGANGMRVVAAPTAFYGSVPPRTSSELVPSVGAFRMSGYAIHETLGSTWYLMKYGYSLK